MRDYLLGCDVLGDGAQSFDPSLLINAVAETGNQLLQNKFASDAKKKSDADDAQKAQAAIVADQSATAANAQLSYAQATNSPDVDALKAAAEITAQAQMDAGMGLSPGAQAARLVAAQKAANDAAARISSVSMKDRQDPAKASQLKMMTLTAKAAADTVMKVRTGGIPRTPPTIPQTFTQVQESTGSFLTTKHAGVPTWGWILGAVAAGTGGYFFLKHRRSSF